MPPQIYHHKPARPHHSSLTIPCENSQCNRWFRSVSGLKKHVRSCHVSTPSHPLPPEHPALSPPAENELESNFEPFDGQDEQENPLSNEPLEDQAQCEIEYHPFLDGRPCDENGNFLPPGAKPVLPETPSTNDWSPYRDRVEFETAELLYKKVQMSGGDINALVDLWRASFIKNGLADEDVPFANKDDLYRVIDSTSGSDVPWESFSLSYNGELPEEDPPEWMKQEFDVWFRSPRAIIQNMLSNRDFCGETNFMPYRKFSKKGEREYKDFMSGEWAWKQADKISVDPTTHGSSFVPVILGSDKTTVSVATGQNEYYPVYISIGNVHNNVRRAHRNAVALLGFLAIPKTEKKYANDVKFRKFRRQLFHTSLARILQDLKPGMLVPEVLRCTDMHFRRVIYGIGPYIADYPEQALLACIVQGWCPRCIAWPNNLDGEGGRRSEDHTEVLANFLSPVVLWDQYGIVSDIVPFTHDFPRADIHEILAPDLLHQVIKGTFKDHLVTWVEDYLHLTYSKKRADEISDDIDRRIAAVPSFPGLRRFPQGRGFKQWTGDDSKALMKVYLPAIEGHVPPDIIRTFQAFLDFCYLVRHDTHSDSTIQKVQDAVKDFHHSRTIFETLGVRPTGFSLPRQHSLQHYPWLIRMFGSPNGLCSSITESRHITAVKEPWRRSSRFEALGQMLLINQRLDKLAVSRVDFTARGMLSGSILDYVKNYHNDAMEATRALDTRAEHHNTEDNNNGDSGPVPGPLTPGYVKPSVRRLRQYSTNCHKLSVQLNQPRLVELLRRFLYSQAHMNNHDAPSAFNIPLHQCPMFNSRVVATHSAVAYFYAPSDCSGIGGMRRETIRATPLWRKHAARYDCAFVERDPSIPGIRGLDVVRIFAFLSFSHDNTTYPCALIQWFSHILDEPDELTGLWKVQPDTNDDGSPSLEIIHLDCIFRSAHLMPVFGDYGHRFIPSDIDFTNSLDKFPTFYINKYIDHHAFGLSQG
ncbi:hypothetical protein SERLADRAFT_449880 [Serpula lacrymans var. lacrymans S7.9]|uniref:C2H2-type domain-containing protein n=1 Tax=Serpula lacrymans var. lacrymans (strain S7.9) TaxID=578457 RepID=F8P0C6_SERL9|nr:uncharacterized protein SERLADRAFT_449880 [Serpula lacrymans var. lacrymans S7.9]EGO23499.1 hypothetical protein SERLADRAFT_449880 [Serpula lacrymans var. lacrymans S7.9]